MKAISKTLVGVLLATSCSLAQADVSANIGYMSEYHFRGILQKVSSVSGGIDYEAGGFYIGTWAADVGDNYYETDSGLDIDALRIVSEGVNTLRGEDPQMGVLLITHYKRILGYLQPDHVHVMLNGRIAHSGGPELADQLEEMGYDWLHEPEPQPIG